MKTVQIGETYNNWSVVAKSPKTRHYLCKCKCGTERNIRVDNLGKVKGCGCDRKNSLSKQISAEVIKKTSLKNEIKAEVAKKNIVINAQPVTHKRKVSEFEQRQADARRKTEDLKIEMQLKKEIYYDF